MSNTIPLAKAEAGVKAVFEAAARDGKPAIAVAIVDRHGDLIVFARMDGAPVRTSTLAPNKAYTAARMERDTADILKMIQDRRIDMAFFGDPRYCGLPGGLVVKQGNHTIGGIGVSGRSSEEDHELGLLALKICQA
jgi:glc operon protein GlcG